MKQTNLIVFYRMGAALRDLDNLSVGMDVADQVLNLVTPLDWLKAFIRETDPLEQHSRPVPMPDSRQSAQSLISLLDFSDPEVRLAIMTPLQVERLRVVHHFREEFEKNFEREQQNIQVFTVMPVGIYDTKALIESAEHKFPPRVLKLLPFPQAIYDLNQAGRCLAFQIPTACAFHTCRATEAVMLRYYELLVRKPWPFPRRDWNMYNEHLAKEGAPPKITRRLDEIREFDRNPYIHPEQNVELDEAPILFELCTGVIFQMAQEMEKLIP